MPAPSACCPRTDTPPSTGRPAPPSGSETALLATVVLASILAPLNSTMIAVALPSILGEFGVRAAAGGWLITAYLVAQASAQPLAGSLGDRVGRRVPLLAGLVFHGLASVGAAFAPSLPILVALRVIQALAGAAALVNGTALLREAVTPNRLASRLGWVGSALSASAALGPPLGGLLVAAAGWRAVFLVNLAPIGAALLLGAAHLPRVQRRGPHRPSDPVGALLLGALLLVAFSLLAGGRGARSLPVPALAGWTALLALAMALAAWSRKHPAPLLQPKLFARRDFAAANAAVALSNLAMYVTLLSVPLVLAAAGEGSPARSGLLLAAMSGAMAAAAPLGGGLSDRRGRRGPVLLGLGLLAAGFLPVALSASGVSEAVLALGLMVSGAGLGLSAAGLQAAALESAPAAESGAAAGLLATSRYLGSVVGMGLLAALLNGSPAGGGALRGAFGLALTSSLAALLAACWLRRPPADR